MNARTYLDFDLQIDELDASTYRARVLNSPVGQAETTFGFPFSEQELEIFFLRIGRPRRGVRRINSPEMNEARRFGSKLYKTIFQDTLQTCLLRSIDKAEQQENGLRLRLRLPASLMDLPWEYLYDASLDRFFSHSTSTPIVRYLDLAQSIKPLAVTPPLKVLVMIASPSDYETLDVEGEWQKIETVVAELKQRGLLQLTRLPAATLGALQKQLRLEQYHIFHFVGHGGFDQQTQDGVLLLLENETGRSRLVSGGVLGTLLHDHASLRLALLNACEGARTAHSDPFAGVAQQLVRQGIPAVIAMQFEITDKAAILLSSEFYGALADGYPVDAALAEARKKIFAEENDIEWGTPVLYLRSVDGQLFHIATQRGDAIPPSVTKVAEGNITSNQNPTRTPSVSLTPTTIDVTKPVLPTPFWRQPWFTGLALTVLTIFAVVWQRQPIGNWLSVSGNPPMPTATLQLTPNAETPSSVAVTHETPVLVITSTVATALTVPPATATSTTPLTTTSITTDIPTTTATDRPTATQTPESTATDTPTTITNATTTTAANGGGASVALITKTETNPFFVKMKEGAEKEAAAKNIKLLTAAGNFDGDNETQITAIENMINAGVKGILITANDSKAIVPTIKKARDAGVLVIALDTPLDPADASDALFATDNVKAGVLIGQYAKAALAGKPAKIAMLDGTAGTTVSKQRHDGFLQGFGIKEGDAQIVCAGDTNGDTAKAQPVMENCLTKDPDINVVYTVNEPAALGANTALKAAGKDKDVVVVSVDGGCAGVQAVKDGKIGATSQQYPLKMASLGVDATVDYIASGKKVSGYTDTGVNLIADKAQTGVDSKDTVYGLENCWGK